MAIIKKKDLKKFKSTSNKEEIDELVDVDGSPIEGDRNPVNNSEIETAPQQTTDDYASTAIQPNRNLRGYGDMSYSGVRRVGESKIEAMIENILENTTNDIPNIDVLANKFQKPIAANKADEVLQSFKKNALNGEEIAIVLNHIISNIDIQQIPEPYRNILKNKL